MHGVVGRLVAPVSTRGWTPWLARPSYCRRVARLRWRWGDVVLPAGLLVLGVLELATLDVEGRGWAVAAQAAAAVLLVWRRTHTVVCAPLAGIVVLLPPYAGAALEDVATPIAFIVVALYSIGRYAPMVRGVGGMAAVLVVTLLVYVTADARSHDWTDVVFVLSLAVPPFVFGRVTRRLADQGELLRQNQELVRREAVRAERDRIARELHDIIAHSVSAMVVQTSAAQDLLRTDPDRAEQVLGDVAATGRRALSETGRLLHTIRDDDDELGLDPAPGVAQLPDLVESFRSGGMDVRFAADDLPALPPGVDVSVYRIVQEALTNALKHGGGAAAVRLAATTSTLSIDAANPVSGNPVSGNPVSGSPGEGSGLGLAGIAERVSLLGGRMRHGLADDGCFELQVRLPLSGTGSA